LQPKCVVLDGVLVPALPEFNIPTLAQLGDVRRPFRRYGDRWWWCGSVKSEEGSVEEVKSRQFFLESTRGGMRTRYGFGGRVDLKRKESKCFAVLHLADYK
jgi:hypothetical protein